jgi:hypothetical protein
MCRCRTSLIRGTKKGHGKISWPNPIGKHIQVLQQNPAKSCRDSDRLACPLRATSGPMHYTKGARKIRRPRSSDLLRRASSRLVGNGVTELGRWCE